MQSKVINYFAISLLSLSLISCGSQNNSQKESVTTTDTSYSLSKGAVQLISDFDTIIEKRGCILSSTKAECYNDTMPANCFELPEHQIPGKPDTQISFLNSYTFDTIAFGTQWGFTSNSNLQNCARVPYSFPIINSTGGSMVIWIVEQRAYQDAVKKVTLDTFVKYRADTMLFRYGLNPIPAKSITRINGFGTESNNLYCDNNLHQFYTNLFYSSGVTLSVTYKLPNGRSSNANCYIMANNQGGTMRWKDQVIKKNASGSQP